MAVRSRGGADSSSRTTSGAAGCSSSTRRTSRSRVESRDAAARGCSSDEVDPSEYGVVDERASRMRSTSPTRASPIRSPRRAAYIDAARATAPRRARASPVEAIEPGRGVRVGGRAARGGQRRPRGRRLDEAAGRGVGLDLPLEIPREQDVVFETAPEPRSRTRCRRRSTGSTCGRRRRGAPARRPRLSRRSTSRSIRTTTTRWSTRRSSRRARPGRDGRLPRLAGLAAVGGRVGLYEVTPDWHPILGPVDGLRGPLPRDRRQRALLQARPRDRRARRRRRARPADGVGDVRDFSLSRFAEGREFRRPTAATARERALRIRESGRARTSGGT